MFLGQFFILLLTLIALSVTFPDMAYSDNAERSPRKITNQATKSEALEEKSSLPEADRVIQQVKHSR